MIDFIKGFYIWVAVLGVSALSGCDALFNRSSPSMNEYINKFFPAVENLEEVDLKFFYKGAVGGYGTIAKINARRSVMKMIIERKTKGAIFFRNVSNEMTSERLNFRIEELFRGSSIPDWVNPDKYAKYELTEVEINKGKIEIFVRSDFTEAFILEIGEGE